MEHYKAQFAADESVSFVGVYSDAGVSGTRSENREGFMRMIEDCRKGLIDCIWTKSVSRFGRNTVDTLIFTRELRGLGIDVFFEKENIHSMDPSGEMLLTLMAAFAESESESMSENIKWGKRRRYEKGLVKSITISTLMGYHQRNGIVTVIEGEADIVRRIFREFLDGYNFAEIASRLNQDGVPQRNGGKEWTITHIRNTLKNEKYAGDCLLQKTFIADPISHRSVPNKGQLDQYLVEGCYPAIIEKREWQVVQEMLKQSRTVRKAENDSYPFTGKLYCAVCGKAFNQTITTATGRELVPLYRCISRKDHSGVEVPDMVYVRPHSVRYTKDPTPALMEYRLKYEKQPEPRPYLCSDTRIAIDRPARAFVQVWNSMVSRKQRYLPILQRTVASDDVLLSYHAGELYRLLVTGERLSEFDTRLFRKTVERIEVSPPGKLTFIFRAGIKMTA